MNPTPIHVVRLDEVLPTRWRNGGGSTRELLAWPRAAGVADWACRISVAQVGQAGPFSVFDGVERWFTVLQGPGVLLRLSQQPHRLEFGSAPLRFDGAEPAWCEPLDGATVDLNLMVRRDAGRGRMSTATADVDWHSTATLRALYCLERVRLQVEDGSHRMLGPNTLAWSERSASRAWRLQADDAAPRAWWLEFEAHPS